MRDRSVRTVLGVSVSLGLATQRYPGDFRWTNVFRAMVYQALVR